MKRLTVMICLALLMGCSVVCRAQVGVPGPGKHNFLSTDQIVRVPFQANRDHVVLTATINGKSEVRLILDTGMPMAGLILIGREKKDEWGLNFISEMPVPDTPQNEEPLMSGIAQGVILDFPGLELTDLTAIVEPADGNIGKMLRDVDGIIGYEIFSQFAVTIDYDKHCITLVEPDKLQVPDGAVKLPLILRDGFPWLACSAEMAGGAVVPLELVVDIGASHALSLNVGSHKNIIPPDNAIETLLGETMSGPIYGKVGRIKSLHLGNLALGNVMTSFQTGPRHGPSAMEKHGNLGNGAFQRFNVTFDYKNESVILDPNSHFSEPFEYNMSGIEYRLAPDGQLNIVRIIPDSPADKTQLSAGDIISTINGRPLGAIRRDELRRMLRQDGAIMKLTALSPDNKTKNVTITLRRVI